MKRWDYLKPTVLSNVDGLIRDLRQFKLELDEGRVPPVNWKAVRTYLKKPHFNVEVRRFTLSGSPFQEIAADCL